MRTPIHKFLDLFSTMLYILLHDNNNCVIFAKQKKVNYLANNVLNVNKKTSKITK